MAPLLLKHGCALTVPARIRPRRVRVLPRTHLRGPTLTADTPALVEAAGLELAFADSATLCRLLSRVAASSVVP